MIAMTVKGVDMVIQQLSRVQRSDGIIQALESLGESARTRAKESLEVSRNPDTGSPYPSLKRKRRGEANSVPLIDSGALLREAAGEFSVARRTLTIRAGMVYAIYHQEGTRTIPQRTFIPTNTQWYQTQCGEVLSTVLRSMKL